MRRCALLAALLGLVVSGPAQARACLDTEVLTAARLNEFATMMMGVSLRCKAAGLDISPGYDAMLTAHRSIFAAADRRLRAFFAGERRAFDIYSTKLGNRYGGGATDPANCQRFERVAQGLSANVSVAALGRVVFAMVTQPHIDGEICTKP